MVLLQVVKGSPLHNLFCLEVVPKHFADISLHRQSVRGCLKIPQPRKNVHDINSIRGGRVELEDGIVKQWVPDDVLAQGLWLAQAQRNRHSK
eukprot:1581092-Amphidinium_carterae.1